MVVYEYSQVTKMDSEVKLNLNEAEEEHASAKMNLASKEKHLEEVRAKRVNLLEVLEKARNDLDALEKRENTCYKKKLRAEELVKVLQPKKSYWLEKKGAIDTKFETFTGIVYI